MNCRDFREIADSYLSDELTVETNHEVFQHLESCGNCRHELARRREVRQDLRLSLINSAEFQIDPVFAARLKANLREQAFRQYSWFNWKILTPVLVSAAVVFSLTFIVFYQSSQTGYAAEISRKAVNRHEDCGLKHAKDWEENADRVSAEKAAFVSSLQNKDTKILEVHDCQVEGKRFTHYILERKGKLISVLKTVSENAAPIDISEENSITCRKEHGLQTSSFMVGESVVFVVSDLSEAENLSLARILSDSIKA